MDSKDAAKDIRDHYEHRISPDRENYDVLDWANAASQQARFQVLVDNVPLAADTRKSLLDVGCGLGDLLGFLKAAKIAVDYTGVDLLAKMVHAARRQHPDGRFIVADIFADDITEEKRPPDLREQYDVVFCSGAFNLDLGNNVSFLAKAVVRMLVLAREHLVFNLLHKRMAGQEHRYFCYDPEEVLGILAPLDCRVRLVDDYLPNDFTVICRK